MTSSLSVGSGGKSQQALTSCKHTILFDFRYAGLGIDKGWHRRIFGRWQAVTSRLLRTSLRFP